MPSPSADAPSAYPATGDPAPADWRDYPPLRLPRILEVALTQMVEHGYDATTVRTIAREVGVTVPALYYHHANKQAILAALLDHAMDMVTRHLDAALTAAGDDPVRRLTAAVEAIALYMAHHRELAFLDSERRALTPENLQHYVRRRDHVDRALGAAIEDGCTAGVFGTPVPDEARRAILSMCQGIASWYRPDGPKTPAQTAQDYVRIALASVEYRALP